MFHFEVKTNTSTKNFEKSKHQLNNHIVNCTEFYIFQKNMCPIQIRMNNVFWLPQKGANNCERNL